MWSRFFRIRKIYIFKNIPKPMTKNNFNKIVKTISECAKVVGKETMIDAVTDMQMI